VVQLTSTTEMSDENSATKKGMADPLPLLPFTYAICMVVSSIVSMMTMMVTAMTVARCGKGRLVALLVVAMAQSLYMIFDVSFCLVTLLNLPVNL